ncbi:5-methyltetrahydropteroyltriglutamate--homocysteine S-methyltransferase [Kurthia zopfii]|uniref:5-methyltetrahydropteroyltriglutamate-- homocysteine S-methyltransferase n=1 Tax=Kurthia zopfii TaxID=1650 RepID=UPI000F6E7A37|nr:5-methyltetrahydropteroyltriglutamate--homocysteine S-methyltransferase [Kurthia zopfii]VEI06330.1 5-methyltetrahydropteroyltriglutamate--homocysteine methyltransferase [Kurthia zopfii]
MTNVKSTTIGYPYIGENREWKRTIERFWKNDLTETELEQQLKQQRIHNLLKQEKLGIDQVTVGDFTQYDRVLDLAFMFNIIPDRYKILEQSPSLKTYYAMARGSQETVACEMTKWFNTNYHYIVPEYTGEKLSLQNNTLLSLFNEAKEVLKNTPKPTLIGPFTFSKITKGYNEQQFAAYLVQLLPLYEEVLQQLVDAGAEWIQIEEPLLTQELSDEDLKLVQVIYKQLAENVPQAKIMLTTYFEGIPQYEQIVQLPVAGIGLDFVHGFKENSQSINQFGFPNDKVLAVGVINGRDIWASNLKEVSQQIDAILQLVQPKELWIQPSCSLQHTPVTTASETELFDVLKNALAFADEKLEEIQQITNYIKEGKWTNPQVIQDNLTNLQNLANHVSRNNEEVKNELNALTEADTKRGVPFETRLEVQQKLLQLPSFPTTTIGSFPQSAVVKKTRSDWRKGDISNEQYEKFLEEETLRWVKIQEELELDVLVHGEFERTDMVEYFGEKLKGFAFTKKAWVVSYGSRCVKPPVIYGDVQWIEPMTVKETAFTQQHTKQWVKGMLTGPVTILNWSFVRDDLSREKVTNQIALALRKEIEALEAAGIRIIQVDEPALREGLPLRKKNHSDYLRWAADAFKISTSTVKDDTQIHTHMCYCEFNDFIDPIISLDADVISLETSRSHGELTHSLKENPYPYGIGLGVYDIHSPRVPSVEEIATILEESLVTIPVQRFWVNPDCGLKTRGETETVAALKNMVQATKNLRNAQLINQ